MKFPHKLVAFDLDGTLAPSKQAISVEMAELLHKLSSVTKVAVISGGSFSRFEEQILKSLVPSPNIILLPAEGSERFEYNPAEQKWNLTDKQPFPQELKEKVMSALREIIASGKYEIPTLDAGDYIEDRDTEIAFSGLGQEADLEKKESWDPDRTKRFKIKEALEAEFDNLMVAVSGTTSIDILPKGFDKAKGLHLLLEKMQVAQEEVVFVGDAIVPGGNDYSVFASGIKSIKVDGPKDTEEAIRHMLQDFSVIKFPENSIAYFCAEYALDVNPAMYAGGLGILAGDYVLQAAEDNKPFIALGLRYSAVIPAGFARMGDILIDVPVGTATVKAAVWHRVFSENTHVLLLDTNIAENTPEQRKFTTHLYDADFYTRIPQQMILGIGGVRLFQKLGIAPRIYHLNEGATVFAAIALAVEKKEDVQKIVATKHTILAAAGLEISFADTEKFIGPYCKMFQADAKEICEKGRHRPGEDFFSTTKYVIESAVRKNGVSDIHVVYEKKRHPQSALVSVTNGVYQKRWQAKEFLNRSKVISDVELWNIKKKLRKDLIDYVTQVSGRHLNPDVCTMVWARRFVGYKRPHLLFSDLERLKSILSNPNLPLQCIISGKPQGNPEDEKVRDEIIAFSNTADMKNRIVYLPDYSIESATKLTRGADLWLNTPEIGMEACGTSGIKASMNGALQCSVKDGWADEVSWEGRGWTLPGDLEAAPTAAVLYDLLEHEILPTFYDESEERIPLKWLAGMRATIELVETSYTAKRMLQDYEAMLYKA